MPTPIKEQVIVITGASSGIGLATAIAAARQGARVVLAARNERDLTKAVESIRRDGGEATTRCTDVATFSEVEALARRAVDHYGRIDLWVNNAAVSAYATSREQPLEDMRRILEVNFLGQVHGAKVALPHLEKTRGALICVGSALSDRGVPLQGMYCAAKHALKGWIDSLRVELQHDKVPVRVTLIKPSSINTPLFNKARTQLGVMPQPIPPIYAAELVADAILRAAVGDERDVYVGGAGKFLSVAERISPRLLDVQQRLKGFESQMTDWPVAPDAPHNLYDPVEWDGGVKGDFLRQEHRRSPYQSMAANPVASSLVGAAVLAVGARAVKGKRVTKHGRAKRDEAEGGGPGAVRGLVAAALAAGSAKLAGKALLAVFYETSLRMRDLAARSPR